MLQLTEEEFTNLMFHFGRSSWGGTRKLPRAFTEQGVAMLSSVLLVNRKTPVLKIYPVKDPARLKWHEVKKVDHYYLTIDALAQHMEIRGEPGVFKTQRE